MDRLGAKNLVDAVNGNLFVADYLVRLVQKTAWTLPADPLLWDILTIAVCFQRSLKLAKGAIPAQLAWSRRFCSSLVDEAVYHREFLFGAVLDAIEIGLVLDGHGPKARDLRENLLAGGVKEGVKNKKPVIVAYLDILGQGPKISNNSANWMAFSKVSRFIELECRHRGLSSYYWRSADTYYVAGTTDDGDDVALKALAKNVTALLLYIQEQDKLVGKKWLWQIGVSVGSAVLIGDILLPDTVSVIAAKLMEAAKANDKTSGGLILADDQFVDLLEGSEYRKLFLFEESKLLDKCRIKDLEASLKKIRKASASVLIYHVSNPALFMNEPHLCAITRHIYAYGLGNCTFKSILYWIRKVKLSGRSSREKSRNI